LSKYEASVDLIEISKYFCLRSKTIPSTYSAILLPLLLLEEEDDDDEKVEECMVEIRIESTTPNL
jgi:hypothetical protein